MEIFHEECVHRNQRAAHSLLSFKGASLAFKFWRNLNEFWKEIGVFFIDACKKGNIIKLKLIRGIQNHKNIKI